jgi:excinuclease ABC subunit C
MQEASDRLEYEKANFYLKTIRQIEQLAEHHSSLVIQTGQKRCDVLGIHPIEEAALIVQLFFREGKLTGSQHFYFSPVAGSPEELLSSFILQQYLDHPSPPEEILLPHTLSDQMALQQLLPFSLSVPQRGNKKNLILLAERNARSMFEKEKQQSESYERLLFELEETLKLDQYPAHIDCIDIAHLQGSNCVAAKVSYRNCIKEPNNTRLFHIRGIPAGDEYAALHQALSRYLQKAKDTGTLPDLLLLDGGKAQLNVALELCRELDIISVDVVALFKEKGKHDKGLRNEGLFLSSRNEPLYLDPRAPILHLLQQIRDEAHRTALLFHTRSRRRRVLQSALDDIPGIGPVKRKRLLTHFGSITRLQQADAEEWKTVLGLNSKDIERLKEYFQK